MNSPDPALRHQLQSLLGPRFVVGDEIGSGGFAHVFEAYDTRLEAKIAVKVLRPELFQESGAEERFLREMRILAELRHPHIVPILDVFQGNGLHAYLMPLIHGPTLAERLARTGALPLEEAVRILTEIGDALDFAHRRGILHRDLKPANILMSEGHALLSDFGIARTIEGSDGAGLTETGCIVGTVGYLSPEQASTSGRIDARSDLYSLAVVGYEILAGRRPFVGDSLDIVLRQQMHGAPTPIKVIRPSVPTALDAAIARGLAPNPADRFTDATELARKCKAALTTTSLPSGRIGYLAGFAIVAIAAAILWQVWRSNRSKPSNSSASDSRAWFVVAQVATRPEDPQLATTIRSLLVAGLDQSPTLGVLTNQEIAGVLRSAGKPESSEVDPTLARELASRARVRGVLETSIDRTDEGSVLHLRAIDIARDSTLTSLNRRIPHGSDILAVAESITNELRRNLESNAGPLASQKNRGATEARTVITADFQAWKLFLLGLREQYEGSQREGLAMFHEAVELDSAFAWAWNGIGTCYANLGVRDSAAYAYRRALRHPDKFFQDSRWGIESALLCQRGDNEGWLRFLDRALMVDPRSPGTWNNRGNALSALGRHEEALVSYQRAELLAPKFKDGIYANTVTDLIAVGRLDDAQTLRSKITAPSLGRRASLGIALARGDGTQIEAAARAVLELSDLDPGYRSGAQTVLASRLANRGLIAESMHELEAALVDARRRQEFRSVESLQWAEASLALAFNQGVLQSQPARASRDDLEARITAAVRDLVAERPREAMAAARELERRYSDEPLMLERAPDLIDAWAASLEGRPRDVVRFGRRITDAPGFGSYFSIRKPVAMWLVAQAYEDLGEADSAATFYERALSTRDLDPEELACSAFFHGPIRQRLALVELRRGRPREARAHAEQFVRMFDRPDPEVRPLLDELQSSLATAGATEPEPR